MNVQLAVTSAGAPEEGDSVTLTWEVSLLDSNETVVAGPVRETDGISITWGSGSAKSKTTSFSGVAPGIYRARIYVVSARDSAGRLLPQATWDETTNPMVTDPATVD